MRSLACATLLVLATPARDAAAATLLVPEQFPSIQAAVDAAADGDTVSVDAGTWYEAVDLADHSITLLGRHGAAVTTIDAQGAGPPPLSIHVNLGPLTKPAANVDGFTLTGGKWTGGLRIGWSNSVVRNCVIRNNEAQTNWASALTISRGAPLIENCIMTGNRLGGWTVLFGWATDGVRMANCTIVGNETTSTFTEFDQLVLSDHGGPLNRTTNCIIRGNPGPFSPIGFIEAAPGKVKHCDIDDWLTVLQPTNFDLDPLFADVTASDFHLTAASPCRGAGAAYPETPQTDWEGDPRGGSVDVGADAFHPRLYVDGEFAAGGHVVTGFVGPAGAVPLLFASLALHPPPGLATPYGTYWIADPLLGGGPLVFPPLPAGGVLPATIPLPAATSPVTIHVQAFLGAPQSTLTSTTPIPIE